MSRIPDDALLARLAHECGKQLHARGQMLACAESCTGGWIAQTLTAIPGSSLWFEGGIVAYAYSAKQHLLGVAGSTLQEKGAVSHECALQMASGTLDALLAAHWSLAVTGIAGPGGATADKPVGTVWFAWQARGKPGETECHVFPGTREEVRRQTVAMALRGLMQRI